MSRKPFVVISGLPGSGKTTLGRRLAIALNLPLIDKDDILEQLFASKGSGNSIRRRALSREADEVLRRETIASDGAVLSSFWHVAGMPVDSGTATAWLHTLSDRVVHVHCVCEPAIAAARFRQRSRHVGHLDANTPYALLLERLRTLASLGPPDLGPRIDVDTSAADPDIARLVLALS